MAGAPSGFYLFVCFYQKTSQALPGAGYETKYSFICIEGRDVREIGQDMQVPQTGVRRPSLEYWGGGSWSVWK